MTTDIVQHPACQPVLALSCVDANNESVEDICATASLLRAVARHTRQPITPQWLYHVARVVQTQANDLDYTTDVWRRLPAKPLPVAHHDAIARQAATMWRPAPQTCWPPPKPCTRRIKPRGPPARHTLPPARHTQTLPPDPRPEKSKIGP